jgi:hypothetical protein
MSTFTTTLSAAAAAAALAATAVVALPAIGDSATKTVQPTGQSGLAACLAAHGLRGAPATGPELKAWLADKKAAAPARVKSGTDACARGNAPGPDIQQIIACVHSHGIDAPTTPEEFKRWVGEQRQAAASKTLDNALLACKAALALAANPGGPAKPNQSARATKTGPPAEKPK